jgi:oligoendopeptidase F
MEQVTEMTTPLVFFDLEWTEIADVRAKELLADDQLEFCRHHLESLRRYRPHLLTDSEEQLDAQKDQTGRQAWVRLFSELVSQVVVEIDGEQLGLERGLSQLMSADRDARRRAAEAVTAGLAPGLRSRGFVYNTLMLDRSINDKLRKYPTWISSWNLANEASDASVEALVVAVEQRYDIARRWYRLKSEILGLDRLADYDRMATVSNVDTSIEWTDAVHTVLDAYASFSPELARGAQRFFDESWIDAPLRASKRPGAFCSYTVPGHHPYLFLNWTGTTRDVLTLAHEMGHGLHGLLARDQGVFHQATPLTVAETASVFGETVTFNRLLEQTSDPSARLSLLASQVEGAIATVFRQVSMNRFENAAHNARRAEGEISVDRLGDLWFDTQTAMFGDTVELTDNYRSWWSYIPHFIGTPGYVYAYAYGQLFALSVYGRYVEEGQSMVPRYLDLLAAGGSRSPEDLGRVVGCDLTDPQFWSRGLEIVDLQVTAAEDAARAAGRLA